MKFRFFLIVCSCIIGNLFAYSGGDGTNRDPYQIANVNDFMQLTNDYNNLNKAFILTANIILDPNNNPAHVFTRAPIANANFSGFAGKFDGDGYAVHNLLINAPAQDSVGLFYKISGIVKNLALINATIQGRSYVGGLVGQNNGSIRFCYVTGSISGTSYVGGVTGKGGSINNCYSVANILATGDYVGGVAGYCGGDISNCYSTGGISGHQYVGGLVGYQIYGKVLNSYATGNVNGLSCIGGLIGQNGSSQYNGGTTRYCYATGNVTASGNGAGGLMGFSYSSTIESCYAIGSVTVTGLTSNGAGGLIGGGYNITSCYATGNVTSEGNYAGGLIGSGGPVTSSYSTGLITCPGTYVGGFAGSRYGIFTNCFWDIETSEQAIGVGFGGTTGVIGKTTLEMQTASTFTEAGWDFNDVDGTPIIWIMSGLSGCPIFPWQPISTLSAAYSGGSGTPENPFKISNAGDILQMSITSWDWNKCFILTADIDLDPNQSGGIVFSQSPIAPDVDRIGCDFFGTPFTGRFNGNGHFIKNLKIIAPDRDYVGLVGRLDYRGEIKYLHLENVSVQGRSYVGSLVGESNRGEISSCSVTGAINGTGTCAGGLVGRNIHGKVYSCHSTASVQGNHSIGGFVGENASGKISLCYATGSVVATSTSTYSYIGGLVGINSSGEVTSCYSTSTINATGADILVGGFLGANCSGEIKSCYAKGNVTGSGSSSANIGGFLGSIYTGLVLSCYSTGTVGTTGSCGSIGGFLGDCFEYGLIRCCFWDTETSGQFGSAGGKGLSSQQMKTMHIFANAEWAGKGWIINDGNDCPRLDWEGSAGIAISAALPISLLGSGTPEDPYQIWTAQDFSNLSWYPSILDKYFVLKADLDVNGISLYPIGDLGQFTGVFDGNGHLIRNITIHQSCSDYVGIFKVLDANAQIKNLNIENASIQGSNSVGILVGQCESGSQITSCNVMGVITGTGYSVGGIVGQNDNGMIISCQTETTITGMSEGVGGVAGTNYGCLSFCNTEGSVIGTSDFVGGLVGIDFRSNILSCYAKADVKGENYVGGLVGRSEHGYGINNSYATGNVTGHNYVGGLVGHNYYSTITTSCATGKISGSFDVGGLVGYNQYKVTNCYTTSAVSGESSVGGLIGYNGYATVTSSYSTGDVSGTGFDIGGLIGKRVSGTITNCFWDTETSFQAISAGGIGKMTAEMKTLETFVGWNFANTWAICEGTNYPRFYWQIPDGDLVCPDGVTFVDFVELAKCWQATTELSADIDANLHVDLADMAVLARYWMQSNCGDCSGTDISHDGSVNTDDLEIMMDQWLLNQMPDCSIAEISGDGIVDVRDLAVFCDNWLK